MKKQRTVLAGIVAVLFLACAAQAAIIIVEDGEGNVFTDWIIKDAMGGGAKGTIDVGPGGAGTLIDGELGMEIAADTSGDPGVYQDKVYEDNDLVGDWYNFGGEEVRRITFSFYADQPSTPDAMSLYFTDGTDDWHFDFTPTQGWRDYGANLIFADGWYNLSGPSTPANFLTSLTSVTQVGVQIQYLSDTASQLYGIDDFALDNQYAVPEPGTYAALSMALISLGATFRRRVEGSVQGLIHRLRA